MWWEGRETESGLGSEVDRLLALYRAHLESPADLVVCGVGAGATVVSTSAKSGGEPQEWHPLLLVDDRSAGSAHNLPPRFSYQLLDSGSQAWGVLADWQPRPDTLVELVGPIVPAVQPGDSYSGSGLATVGLPVNVLRPPVNSPNTHGFLTVAHGVGPVGSAVTVTTRTGSIPGHVQFRDESARGPGPVGGDDIALVVLDPPHELGAGWLLNQGTQPAPGGPPYVARAVDLFGGRSGKVIAQVNGVLSQMGDRTWQWLDCWELGVTQPLLQRGDSGALAIDPTSNPHIFGHFVGGNIALRGNGFTHHWVQDLGQVLGRQADLNSMIAF